MTPPSIPAELLSDLLKERPVEETGMDNIIVVDNAPKVELELATYVHVPVSQPYCCHSPENFIPTSLSLVRLPFPPPSPILSLPSSLSPSSL